MMILRKGIAALLLCCMVLLCGCVHAAEEPTADYRVIVATDLHYFAPSLTDRGEMFHKVMDTGDGKVTEYCDETTDAFLAEVIARRPDALILTGDLSYNGERASHEALAEKLARTEAAGIPVLVLPGNHDYYRSAYAFFGDSAEELPPIMAEDFREIYAAFGFDEALSSDGDSLSYVAALNNRARVMMLDANTLHDFCGLLDKTLAWIESELDASEKAGQTMLVACHQNLYKHSMFGAGYVLSSTEKLQALLEKHHVPLFLSGHMHIQHIRTEGEITEIAGSPLTMGACQYGVLDARGGKLRYETHRVDVSAWAAEQGRSDEDLLRFDEYAYEKMAGRTRAQAAAQLEQLGWPQEEIEAMTDYAVALNTSYFYGDLSGIPELDPDGSLQKRWEESGGFFSYYFQSMRGDIGLDYTRWTSGG